MALLKGEEILLSHEFGIMESVTPNIDYNDYTSSVYNSITVHDEIVQSFLGKLNNMPTYF